MGRIREIRAALACGLWGLLAFMIAKACGVPVWIAGWVLPGDATDMGVTVAFALWASWLCVTELSPSRA